MKRFFTMMLFFLVALGSYAGDKVRGVLRTEINGFQWYCYQGKNEIEAYSINGNKIISLDNSKAKIVDLRFVVVNKNDEGMFVVTSYIKDSSYHGWYTVAAYTPNGKCLVSKTDTGKGKEEYGLPQIERLIESVSGQPLYFIQIVAGGRAYGGPSLYDSTGKVVFEEAHSYKKVGNLFNVTNHSIRHDIYIYNGVVIIKDANTVYERANLLEIEKDGNKGLLSLLGMWIVKPEKGFADYNTLNIGNDIFYIIRYKNSSKYNLISSEGNDVLGKEFDAIESNGNKYIKVRSTNYYGISSLDGKEIIPTSRGYTYIGDFDRSKGTFAFTKKGFSGVCDAQGREISTTRLAPTADDIKANGGYASAVEIKYGSTKYYKVSKGGRYGLTDSEGKEIVPCEMEALESAGTGYLKYKINGFWGLMNYTGKILIDTDRGYTSIGDFKTFNKRFPYTMAGYKGECDATGRQISKIKVESPKQAVATQTTTTPQTKEGEQKIIIEHKRDPIPVNVWVQCNICGGSGKCQTCGGTGIFTGWSGNKTLCEYGCGGSGKCSFCAGQGGHYEVQYK